jgi:hypothetical protein
MQLHELERDFDPETQKNQERDGRKGVPRTQGTIGKKRVESVCGYRERTQTRILGKGSAVPVPFWITVKNLPCDYV